MLLVESVEAKVHVQFVKRLAFVDVERIKSLWSRCGELVHGRAAPGAGPPRAAGESAGVFRSQGHSLLTAATMP